MKRTSPLRVGSPFSAGSTDPPDINRPSAVEGRPAVDAEVTIDNVRSVDGTTPQPISDDVRPPILPASQAAMTAATILVAFSIASSVYFPVGGVAISVLGIAMSLASWTPQRPWLAIGLLGIHGLLFIACYLRTI